MIFKLSTFFFTSPGLIIPYECQSICWISFNVEIIIPHTASFSCLCYTF